MSGKALTASMTALTASMTADELLRQFPKIRDAVFQQHRTADPEVRTIVVDGGVITMTPLRVDANDRLVPSGDGPPAFSKAVSSSRR